MGTGHAGSISLRSHRTRRHRDRAVRPTSGARWRRPWASWARRCISPAGIGRAASGSPPSSAAPASTPAGVGCDVTDEAEVEGLVGRVAAERDRLDIMVCNAGGAFTTTYLPDASIDELRRRALDLNVTGTYACAQAAARVMIPGGGGRIITLGSIHGTLGADKRLYAGLDYQRSGPPYQAAKGAVVNLTRALATELAEQRHHGQLPVARPDPVARNGPRLRRALPPHESPRPDRRARRPEGRRSRSSRPTPAPGSRVTTSWSTAGGASGRVSRQAPQAGHRPKAV